MTIQSGTLGLGAQAVAGQRRFIWDSDRVVADAQFLLRVCFFLPCYKASDSIGEVFRSAGLRVRQPGEGA